jgi:DivIVA protein
VNGSSRRNATIDRPQAGQQGTSRFSDLAERVVGALASNTLTPSRSRLAGDPGFALDPIGPAVDESVLPPFATAKYGYDRDAVDERMADLEASLLEAHRELLALREQTPTRMDIAAEIERLGEQTSAILITAHDTASETLTIAQTDAGTRIADAAAYAAALREEAKNERHKVEVEIDRLRRERGRLIGEIESTAAALSLIAREAVGH